MRNTAERYGWIAIVLHWFIALVIFAMLGLGLYMVELGYYDPWYNALPNLHKSVGILFGCVLVLAIGWRWCNPSPTAVAGTSDHERWLARSVHHAFHPLIALILISGYLIPTADGSAIVVFDLFSVPASITDIPRQEDNAGLVHEYLSYVLIALVTLHVVAALKHHFIDRDNTLRRILGIPDR